MPVRFIFILVLTVMLFSCNEETKKTKLAQVYDKFLYLEDIQSLIPKEASFDDSLMIVKNKIDLWVRKQTILKRAELNLTEEQKDIDDIVEDYRASLIIEKYKQEYIKQEIDTNITDKEIKKYYNDYTESFKLNQEIVIALFFKLSVENEVLNKFIKAYYSDDEEKMISIAEDNKITFMDFKNKWVEVSNVLNLLPNNFNNPELILNQSKKIQTRDEEYYYFVIFKDYKLKGDRIPLERIKDRIKIILLNKRKTNIINKLEKNIYLSDKKNNNIKIFTE